MKLLHIDASILGDNSVSRQISAAAVARLRKTTSDVAVTYRDLSSAPLSHLSGAHLAAAQGVTPATATLRDDVSASVAALDEFLAADTVVIGAPMYNFTLPSQLKAWIDRIVIAGKTFRYTESGPEGLAGGKRVIIAIARGGVYGGSSPAASSEHLETYLRTIFGFIGIHPEFVIAEGMLVGPEQREKAVTGALHATEELRAA
jgi:FMN-dependent NADH-azoreductase